MAREEAGDSLDERDPLLHDLVFVLQLLHDQRLERFVFSHQFGFFGELEIEGRVLRGNLSLLFRARSEELPDAGEGRAPAARTGSGRSSGLENKPYSVIDWMNFFVMESSAFRWDMSTLRSVSISRMFSLRSSII
jgi:hypothetical protein